MDVKAFLSFAALGCSGSFAAHAHAQETVYIDQPVLRISYSNVGTSRYCEKPVAGQPGWVSGIRGWTVEWRWDTAGPYRHVSATRSTQIEWRTNTVPQQRCVAVFSDLTKACQILCPVVHSSDVHAARWNVLLSALDESYVAPLKVWFTTLSDQAMQWIDSKVTEWTDTVDDWINGDEPD